MRSSSGLKAQMMKKYKKILTFRKTSTNQKLSLNEGISNQTLSSMSSNSNNSNKLSQLKQNIQRQRENMRSSGRRFKESSIGNQIEIQTNSQQLELNEPIKKQNSQQLNTKTKFNKVTTGISTSTAAGLYDFNSIKTHVENKTNKLFQKKPIRKQDVIQATKSNKLLKQQKVEVEKVNYADRKKDTVNLMELSTILDKSPQKSSTTSKQKIQPVQNSSLSDSFVNLTKKPAKNSFDSDILSNSRVFESAINQQKRRNKQVEQFLSAVGLQQFSQHFINMGFDQIQTIVQISVDELNQMMMRAPQQRKLMAFINKYKQENQIETEQQKPLVNKPATIHSIVANRPKSAALTTEPSETHNIDNSRLSNMSLSNPQESTLMNKSSIFYFVGGSDWSLDDQVRKACSGCFKVTHSVEKIGDCYYCEDCNSEKFDLGISLDDSMVRSYHV